MIRREKGLELMIFKNNQFEHTFGSNVFFENVALIKVIHIYLIEGMIA